MNNLALLNLNNKRAAFDEIIVKKGVFFLEGSTAIFHGAGKILFKDRETGISTDLDTRIINSITQCFQDITVQNPLFEGSLNIKQIDDFSSVNARDLQASIYFEPEIAKDDEIIENMIMTGASSLTKSTLKIVAKPFLFDNIDTDRSADSIPQTIITDANILFWLYKPSQIYFKEIYCDDIIANGIRLGDTDGDITKTNITQTWEQCTLIGDDTSFFLNGTTEFTVGDSTTPAFSATESIVTVNSDLDGGIFYVDNENNRVAVGTSSPEAGFQVRNVSVLNIPTMDGISMGMSGTNSNYAIMKLCSSDNTGFSQIDFTLPDVKYYGRLSYDFTDHEFIVKVGGNYTQLVLNMTTADFQDNILTTTGDLIINSNVLYVDSSSSRVGIGSTTLESGFQVNAVSIHDTPAEKGISMGMRGDDVVMKLCSGSTDTCFLDFTTTGEKYLGQISYDNDIHEFDFTVDRSTQLILSTSLADFKDNAITTTNTITCGTLTDGTATLTSGVLASIITINATGTITGNTLSDGSTNIENGNITVGSDLLVSGSTNVSTLTASGVMTVNNVLNVSGNITSSAILSGEQIFLNGDMITATNVFTINSTSGFIGINKDVPTVALDVVGAITATGAITGDALTDGTATLTNGDLSCDNITITGSITGVDYAETIQDAYDNNNTPAHIQVDTGFIGAFKIKGNVLVSNVLDIMDETGAINTSIARNGYVGIGTSSPDSALHVVGARDTTPSYGVHIGYSDSATGNFGIEISSNSTGDSVIDFTEPNTDTKGRILYDNSTEEFKFRTNSTGYGMVLDSSNDLTLTGDLNCVDLSASGDLICDNLTFTGTITGTITGLITTDTLQDAYNNTSSAPHITIDSGTTGAFQIKGNASTTNSFSIINDNDVEQFVITRGGYMGIGTTTPESALHVVHNIFETPTEHGIHMGMDVNGSLETTHAILNLVAYDSADQSTVKFSRLDGAGSSDVGGEITYAHSSEMFKFKVGNTTQMNIASNAIDFKSCSLTTTGAITGDSIEIENDLTVGLEVFYVDSASEYVGINSSSPLVALHVIGSIMTSDKIIIERDSSSANSSSSFRRYELSANSGADLEFRAVNNGSSIDDVRMTLTTGGDLDLSTGTFTAPNITIDTDLLTTKSSTNCVGIGTTTPESALHVVGLIDNDPTEKGVHMGMYTSSSHASLTLVANNSSSHCLINMSSLDGAGSSNIGARIGYDHSLAELYFRANNVVQMTMTNNAIDFTDCQLTTTGNVGIGTTTPESALHVIGIVDNTPTVHGVHMGMYTSSSHAILNLVAYNSGNQSTIRFTRLDGSGGSDIGGIVGYNHNLEQLYFNASNATQMTIENNAIDFTDCQLTTTGNVGVKTTSPLEALHVIGNIMTSDKIIIERDSSTANSATTFRRFELSVNSGADLEFRAVNSTIDDVRMTLKTGGDLDVASGDITTTGTIYGGAINTGSGDITTTGTIYGGGMITTILSYSDQEFTTGSERHVFSNFPLDTNQSKMGFNLGQGTWRLISYGFQSRYDDTKYDIHTRIAIGVLKNNVNTGAYLYMNWADSDHADITTNQYSDVPSNGSGGQTNYQPEFTSPTHGDTITFQIVVCDYTYGINRHQLITHWMRMDPFPII